MSDGRSDYWENWEKAPRIVELERKLETLQNYTNEILKINEKWEEEVFEARNKLAERDAQLKVCIEALETASKEISKGCGVGPVWVTIKEALRQIGAGDV